MALAGAPTGVTRRAWTRATASRLFGDVLSADANWPVCHSGSWTVLPLQQDRRNTHQSAIFRPHFHADWLASLLPKSVACR